MKTDIYTKIILTVIAVNLTVLTLMKLNIVPEAFAVGAGDYPVAGQAMQYGLIPVNDDGSITVRLANSDEIDVNITDISTSDKLNVSIAEIDTWDNMNVTIKEIDTRDKMNVKLKEVDNFAFSYCTVPVEIKE